MDSGEGLQSAARPPARVRTRSWGVRGASQFSMLGWLGVRDGPEGCPHPAPCPGEGGGLLHTGALTVGCTVAGGIELQGVRAAPRTHLHIRGDNPQRQFPHHDAVGQGPRGTLEESTKNLSVQAQATETTEGVREPHPADPFPEAWPSALIPAPQTEGSTSHCPHLSHEHCDSFLLPHTLL